MGTVDNVLKVLPLINDEKLDRLCMVTSDYHMERACAIYDQFIDAGLCRYETYHAVKAVHTEAPSKDAKFLETQFEGTRKQCPGCDGEHENVIEEILCPNRDGNNAEIFARYINLVK